VLEVAKLRRDVVEVGVPNVNAAVPLNPDPVRMTREFATAVVTPLKVAVVLLPADAAAAPMVVVSTPV
jgi:hypothetical protein